MAVLAVLGLDHYGVVNMLKQGKLANEFAMLTMRKVEEES